MVFNKAGLVGIVLLSLIPTTGIGKLAHDHPKTQISSSEQLKSDSELIEQETKDYENMTKEGENSNNTNFYSSRLKSALGKKYEDLSKDQKKKESWNRYWENSSKEVLKKTVKIYSYHRYFLNSLSEEQKKDLESFKRNFKVEDFKKRGYFDYFSWIDENNITESDFSVIWDLDYRIKSVTPSQKNKNQ